MVPELFLREEQRPSYMEKPWEAAEREAWRKPSLKILRVPSDITATGFHAGVGGFHAGPQVELEFTHAGFCGGRNSKNPEKNHRNKSRTDNNLNPHIRHWAGGRRALPLLRRSFSYSRAPFSC